MYDYKQASNSKYTDIPTAAKTHYQDGTPYRGTDFGADSYRSPSRYSLKLNEAKQAIGSLIGEISAKKSLNHEGIGRVYRVNSEALDALNTENNLFSGDNYVQPFDSYHTATPNKKDTYSNKRKASKTTGYDEHQSTGVFPSQFKSISQFKPNGSSVEQENQALKRALSQQMNQNEALMQRISAIQNNKKTRQGGFASPQIHKGSSDSVPEFILRQLEQLKRENEKLRKDTISLLNSKKY